MKITIMDWQPYITALFGLAGALIGGGATLLGIHYQASKADRRARVTQVVELAIADLRLTEERAARAAAKGQSVVLYPLAVMLHYNERLLALVESDDLSIESYCQLCAEAERFTDALREYEENQHR